MQINDNFYKNYTSCVYFLTAALFFSRRKIFFEFDQFVRAIAERL